MEPSEIREMFLAKAKLASLPPTSLERAPLERYLEELEPKYRRELHDYVPSLPEKDASEGTLKLSPIEALQVLASTCNLAMAFESACGKFSKEELEKVAKCRENALMTIASLCQPKS